LVEEDAGLQTMQYELTLTALRGERSAALARRQYEQYVRVAEEVIDRACEASGERPRVPVSELARFLVAGLDGLIMQHLTDPDTARSRAGVDRVAAAACALAVGDVRPPKGDR
jgi:Tetracyclin repressor-like, C-terminal domain